MNLSTNIKNWSKSRVLKGELKEIGEENSYVPIETENGEPVLIRVVENNDFVLTVELLYAVRNKIYRATFLGNYIGTEMVIADIKVLKQPSYSPKKVEPFGKGYGILLMKRAIVEATNKGIVQITGDRVATSPAQFERQTRFYSKFGFIINEENKLFKAL